MIPDIRSQVMRKVAMRFIPLMIAMFCANFLDRVNIGFAALQMNRDLHLTPEIYGFAAGLLFIPYALFEIPSNMILDKVGPRIWIARIMITWGIISCLNAFVWDKYSLYAMRCLLGFAEAGLFPGLMVFMVKWFPAQERGRAITLFMLGNPLCVIFCGPLSTAILSLDGLYGIAGWKYLLFIEGLPAIVLGFLTLRLMLESPAEATFLKPAERAWLIEELEQEDRAKVKRMAAQNIDMSGWFGVFRHGPTLMLCVAKCGVLLAFFGVTLWLPQIIKQMGHMSNLEVGFLTALPYVFSALVSVWVGQRSDRTGERAKHIAIPALIGSLGFVLAGFGGNPWLAMAGLCIATTGVWIANTVFWALPAQMLRGSAAAVGFALVNSSGNLGGFFGPYITGAVVASTGSYGWALTVLGGFLALSAVIILLVVRPERPVEDALGADLPQGGGSALAR